MGVKGCEENLRILVLYLLHQLPLFLYFAQPWPSSDSFSKDVNDFQKKPLVMTLGVSRRPETCFIEFKSAMPRYQNPKHEEVAADRICCYSQILSMS